MFDLDKVFVVDIECDGLLEELTKLHVLSCAYKTGDTWTVKSTKKEEDISKLFSNPNNIIVGHFFLGYDIPALKKLFPNIVFNAQIIDTLPLSQYLYNERQSHGLEAWGTDLGVKKVEISDEEWKNLSYEKAKERCEEDCKINVNLYLKMLKLLRELYSSDEEIFSVMKYANFKILTGHAQYENRIKLDVKKCEENLAYLEGIIEEKILELKKIMPDVPKKVKRNKPKVLFKKDGTESAAGLRWFNLLDRGNLPRDYEGEVVEIVGYDEPNPQSNTQMKEFLLSKNWIPKLFKEGANGKVPQLRDDDKNLCTSILKLVDKFPELKALDGLSVAQHRSGYLKAFLETKDKDNYIIASFSGMAKTWRAKHKKPIVNLPANNAEYGELVRSVLIAPEGKLFVNADLSSLEDKTKQAGIYDLDREYVEQLNVPGYDAHLSIALKAGFMTEDEVHFFKWYKKKVKSRNDEDLPESFANLTDEEMKDAHEKLTKVRSGAKTTNYACTYSASPKKIAETADISLKEAKKLHKAYWDVNWSIKRLADSFETKVVDGRKWIYSPFSKLWLLLTAEHIKFSAVNQNFGAKVFDLFLYYLIDMGVKPIMTMHDELSWYINEGEEGQAEEMVKIAMEKVNRYFNLPITFESEPEFAKSYGELH